MPWDRIRARHYAQATAEQVERVATLYERINAAPLLLEPGLWLGVLAAAVLLAIAIRLRRWRDDT